jgi:hypothetical protein
MILLSMMTIDRFLNHLVRIFKMLRKEKCQTKACFFLQISSLNMNRNIDEARAIFGEEFNFDGIDFNELNDDMEDGDVDEDDDEEDEDMDAQSEYDEEGNLIANVRNIC